jgi:Uma2 family endonuclease
VKKENLGIVKDWIRGTPDLVLEVVSKGSVTLDTVTKKSIYEKYKVPELWLVFPEQECIEVFAWENGRYSLFSTSDEFGKIKSRILTGFEMEIMRIFRKK